MAKRRKSVASLAAKKKAANKGRATTACVSEDNQHSTSVDQPCETVNSDSCFTYADVVKGSAVCSKDESRVNVTIATGLPTSYILAGCNQGNPIFGNAAGRQCVPSCYLATIENCLLKSADTWASHDIERFITLGGDLYLAYKPDNHNYFAIDDLPRELSLGGNFIRCLNFTDKYGFMERDNPSSIEQLVDNLNTLFQQRERCGVMCSMADYGTTILKTETSYHVLDTHSRDAQGKPCGDESGSAGLFQFPDVISVAKYLVRQSQLLSTNPMLPYELCVFEAVLETHSYSSKISSSVIVTTPRIPVHSTVQCDNDANNVANLSNDCSKADVESNRSLNTKSTPTTAKRSKYRDNPEYRERAKARSRAQYELKRNRLIDRYEKDTEYREGLLATQRRSKRIKYQNEEHHKNVKKEYQNDRYRHDAEYKATHKTGQKEYQNNRYLNDAEYRTGQKEYQNDRYLNDAEYKATHKTGQKEYQNNRYLNDAEYRTGQKKYQNDRYLNDAEYKATHKTGQKEYQNDRYLNDAEYREQMLALSAEQRSEIKTKRSDLELAIQEFKRESQKGPCLVCSCCQRLMFEKQVKILKLENYLPRDFVEDIITTDYKHFSCVGDCSDRCTGKEYICHTCHEHLGQGRIPPQAIANNMRLLPLDDVFKSLNSLEQQLISLEIPFEKLVTLPRTFQNKIQGPVTLVPSNVRSVTDTLPRPLGASKIVAVKLKRKLVYKGYVDYQVIDAVKIKSALSTLKTLNPEYKNVKINDNWHETQSNDEACLLNDLVIDETTETPMETDSGDTDNEDDPVLYVNGNAMDSSMQPVDVSCELSAEEIDHISIAPAEGNIPVNILTEERVEAKTFPALFPDGQNTFDCDRKTKLTRSKYYNARIFSVDSRFAPNAQYIFFAQYAKEYEQLLSSISISLRKGSSSKHVTPQMLLNPSSLQTILKSDQGFRYFESIRGSPEFWKKTMNDLFAMIRSLGIPTWFLTLTSAELSRWTCHIGAILRQQGHNYSDEHISNMDYREKCKVIKSNPVTAVRMWYQRVDLFFRLILQGPCHPIGKIKDFFYRVEFQARGVPHIHCLFWIEDSPKFGVNTDEEVCGFIDQYVKAELPDINKDPELHDLVSNLQMHSKNHSKSCRKRNKKCRFNFPKCIADETFITNPLHTHSENDKSNMQSKLKKLMEFLESGDANSDDDNQSILSKCGFTDFIEFQETMKRLGQKPSIVLKRHQSDVWVNNYCPSLLRAWNANMDIQFVLDPWATLMYIVSYISKSESEMSEVLKQAREDMIKDGQGSNSRQLMRSLGHKYFTHREVCIQEAIVRLCGLKLKQCSRQIVFVPTNEEDTRMSLPLSQIQNAGHKKCTDIWYTTHHERYCARPKTNEFETMCQAKFFAEYRVLSKTEVKKSEGNENMHELLYDRGYILKRTRSDPAVIRYTRFSSTRNPEQYYLSMLLLYLPHRSKTKLKSAQYDTYERFYTNAAVKIGHNAIEKVCDIVKNNEDLFGCNDAAIDEACDLLKESGNLEDAWSMVAPNVECDRQEQLIEQVECAEVDEDNIVEPIPGLSVDPPTNRGSLCSYELVSESLRPQLRSMNTKQQQLFYYIRDYCKKRSLGVDVNPIFIHIDGGAGVGKSFLIKSLYAMCHKLLRKPDAPDDTTVLLLAPTGTAAHNISGFTIHSALKVPIKTSSYTQFAPLTADKLNTLQCLLANVQIVIIDEVSMVSPNLLQYVDSRLKQIKGISQSNESAPFGNISIICVGDFFQLAPVKNTSLVLPSADRGHLLFVDNFKRVELDEVMRQRDDATFANMLNRLRVKRKKEELDAETMALLSNRVNLPNEPDDALHVYARNADVNSHNDYMLEKVCDNVYTIHACDYQQDKASGKMSKVSSIDRTASNGLAYVLKLGVNSRVMLTKNLDLKFGLCNGVFGTVVGVDGTDNVKDPVDKIYVLFDDERVGKDMITTVPPGLPPRTVAISKSENPLEKNMSITRRQFPLKLGWGATVHKTQGMTVDRIVYDMDHTFQPGQAYVALSRVTSLNGLFLKTLKPSLIYMNESIHSNLETIPLLSLDRYNVDSADIVCHNVQSIQDKLDDIKSTYAKYTKIMCITETWLSSSTDDTLIDIEHFCLYRSDRIDNTRRGGSAIYVCQDFQQRRVILNPSRHIEVTLVQLNRFGKVYAIGCVYRPGTVSVSESINYIAECLQVAEGIPNVCHVIFVGDFNENLLNDSLSRPIHDMFHSHGYSQLVSEATHSQGGLLDAVYTKDVRVAAAVKPIYFSDHESLHITIMD